MMRSARPALRRQPTTFRPSPRHGRDDRHALSRGLGLTLVLGLALGVWAPAFAVAVEPAVDGMSAAVLAPVVMSAAMASPPLGPTVASSTGIPSVAAAPAAFEVQADEERETPQPGWLDAGEIFERLKVLEGTWQAHFIDADAPSFTVVYQLSARDTVLIETSHPGAHIEMKTIFLVAGDELQVQHLCAFGSQPSMRLDRSRGNGYDLYFQHTGGTNLRGDDSMWMRLDRVSLFNDDYFETEWSTFKGKEPFGPPQGIAMVRME